MTLLLGVFFFPPPLTNWTALCFRSSNPASSPRCPSIQQLVQYKSPSQPMHRRVASSLQIMHHVSISSSVKPMLGLAADGVLVDFMPVGTDGSERPAKREARSSSSVDCSGSGAGSSSLEGVEGSS